MNAGSNFIALEFADSLSNWAEVMPNLNVYLLEGHSDAQKELLLARMTDAVVDSIAAPKASVRIFLIELPRTHGSVWRPQRGPVSRFLPAVRPSMCS